MVYYNPSDPAESVLIRGIQQADYLPLILLAPPTTIMLLLWMIVYQTMSVPARFAGLRGRRQFRSRKGHAGGAPQKRLSEISSSHASPFRSMKFLPEG